MSIDLDQDGPEPDGFEQARRVVDELNHAHGLRFALVRRCDGGFQGGAWHLRSSDGRRAVLKWRQKGSVERFRRVAETVAALRSAGYPTPSWPACGITGSGAAYHLQEFVPGRSATPLTPHTAGLLVEVLERHAGQAPVEGRDWSAHVMATVRGDPPDGPRRVVRGLGAAGAALLAHYDRLLARNRPPCLPTDDLVHGDFNSCNVLLHQGRVSGVIDVDALGAGTRAFDYACLLRETYVEGYGRDVARLLRRAGEAVAGPPALAVCAAATAFEIVRFKLRHQPDRVPDVLARLHDLAEDLAEPLRTNTARRP